MAGPPSQNRDGMKKKPIAVLRTVRKPLMEKRRRDRINTCLKTLSRFLFEAQSSPSSGKKRAKLEKADILENTVLLLRNSSKQATEKVGEKKKEDTESHFADEPKSQGNSFLLGYESCMKIADAFLNDLNQEKELQTFRKNLIDSLKENIDSYALHPERSNESFPTDSADFPQSEITYDYNSTKTLMFIPKLLSNGSFALVVKDEKDDDENICLPEHIPSSPLRELHFPTNTADIFEGRDQEKCVNKTWLEEKPCHPDIGEEVKARWWRPWDQC